MGPFSPVTEAELARARNDPDFRQRLLQQSLDILLSKRLGGAACGAIYTAVDPKCGP